MLPSQTSHRSSFVNMLTEDIRVSMLADGQAFHVAATRVLLRWLGYDSDDLKFLDSQDRGIDAWMLTEAGIDLFQIKTHVPDENGFLTTHAFDNEGVQDLARAKSFLLHEHITNIRREPLRQLLGEWSSLLRSRKQDENSTAIAINLHLVILGEELTDGAKKEWDVFALENYKIEEVEQAQVEFHVVLHTLNNIIDTKWREQNRDWIDRYNKRTENVSLRVWREGAITDNQNAVFYCHAVDLVDAYERLGYQIFEPNVRANIKNSRVNSAIRDSASHRKSRHEFRFLNNGVTITCDSFTKPRGNQQNFTIHHPGIVNGLQTVVALHSAYQSLSGEDKEDFDRECAVLVRLLNNNAVEDISQVVKSTNNQNPMKPRNLVSNNTEQLMYARMFANEYSWFYEAKEGAWDAYSKDPKRWRPALHKSAKDFKVSGRNKVKRIDNEQLAQTWLSFIGFSHEAVNDKKAIFEDRFYSLIFNKQTKKHGYEYDFSHAKALKDAEEISPDPAIMLVAFLCREFALGMALPSSQNRALASSRLGIDLDILNKSELDAKLAGDNQFLLQQALSSMSVIFTEFVGYVLFRAFGSNVHKQGKRILQHHSFRDMTTNYDTETAMQKARSDDFDGQDLLIVLWLAFVDAIESMMATGWGQSYRLANVKPRFISSTETRERLFKLFEDQEKYMKKRALTKLWAVGIPEKQGLFDYVRDCIS